MSFHNSSSQEEVDKNVRDAKPNSTASEVLWSSWELHRVLYGWWPGNALREAATVLERVTGGARC